MVVRQRTGGAGAKRIKDEAGILSEAGSGLDHLSLTPWGHGTTAAGSDSVRAQVFSLS